MISDVQTLVGLDYANPHQPYYIVPTTSLTAHAWHKVCALCSALNRLGYDSYIHTAKAAGQFWAPLLSPHVQAGHYLAGKKPIVLNFGLAEKSQMKLGIHASILWEAVTSQTQLKYLSTLDHVYVQCEEVGGDYKRLHLPLPELAQLSKPNASLVRTKSLLYHRRYNGAIDFAHQAFEKIDEDFADKLDRLKRQLQTAKYLYLYEWSELAVLARWTGCAVVLVPNAQCLAKRFDWIDTWGGSGLAWGTTAEELQFALETVGNFEGDYRAKVGKWQADLLGLIFETQQRANATEFNKVWPQIGLDTLPELFIDTDQLAARADRLKWGRLHEQYAKWTERSSLREIDAQIYAEHLMSGSLPQISVVIDHCGTSIDQLADTLDSLSAAFGQAEWVGIVSTQPAPNAFEPTGRLAWFDRVEWQIQTQAATGLATPWTLVIRAGTVLATQALVEWMLATITFPAAKMIYADEDMRHENGPDAYPYFKPDVNVELLRCTNYLGGALLVRSADWHAMGSPLHDGRLYGAALTMIAQHGKSAFGHIDTILFHADSALTAASENAEFDAAKTALKLSHCDAVLSPLARWGTWLLRYQAPVRPSISLVVPTGLQTGYLGRLLKSLTQYCSGFDLDIVLVCQEIHRPEIELVTEGLDTEDFRLFTTSGAMYNHAAALNLGIQKAQFEVVLVADDDTELLQRGGVEALLGILGQDDVGCVAPRLVTSHGADPKIVAGPMILGVGGSACSYLGEAQGLAEAGVFSRLQLTQDVSSVAGHFFAMKRSHWQAVGGFDEVTFPVFNTVLDFCLKVNALGKRHVWTPLTNVLHQGGKTLELKRRNIQQRLSLAEQEVSERQTLHARWASELANDRNYNRHLSLFMPFDIESDIVVDWQPRRHDRPRVLALPLSSGAGQFRVIDPLNALQDAGLAQTSTVLPFTTNKSMRLVQPLELVRTAPDRLILQHSVDDGQLSLIDGFKNAAPYIKIIQTVDDLLGEVSEKHPNYHYQIREGHPRMMEAVSKSDRLIVTTQPLADYYKKYVADVHIIPNTLGAEWIGLRKPPNTRSRLRVGWVGAGQHQGDLELVNTVVRELAAEVDWIFMGMCTDEIKPLLTEFHGFVSIGDYPKKMSSLDLDIAIAPIEDNFFNQCKSNLRLLEYGAMGWPVVCSDVYPYRTDNPPVLRVKNDPAEWVNAIRSLYDGKRRHANAEALHQWVLSKYKLESKSKNWFKSIFG